MPSSDRARTAKTKAPTTSTSPSSDAKPKGAQYLAKGRKVAIEGRLHHSEWDSDNGRRQKLEVIARNVEFLDARKADDNNTTSTQEGGDPARTF